MVFDIGEMSIPEFDPFIRESRDKQCTPLRVNNIVAEILGGKEPAVEEVKGSQYHEKIILEGQYSIILRYKRETNGEVYPAVIFGFDISPSGKIIIRHIQGTKQRRIGYRFSSSFDTFAYFKELIQENFTSKGIKVELSHIPTNLESSSYGALSPQKYRQLQQELEYLNSQIIDN